MQEYLFQIRLRNRKVIYLSGGQRAEQAVHVAAVKKADGTDLIFPVTHTIQVLQVDDAVNGNPFCTCL